MKFSRRTIGVQDDSCNVVEFMLGRNVRRFAEDRSTINSWLRTKNEPLDIGILTIDSTPVVARKRFCVSISRPLRSVRYHYEYLHRYFVFAALPRVKPIFACHDPLPTFY